MGEMTQLVDLVEVVHDNDVLDLRRKRRNGELMVEDDVDLCRKQT